MAEYERWQMGDPAKVLERKGEPCDGCRHLERWNIAGTAAWRCANPQAPEKLRKGAPARRCDAWRHEQADGGQ